MKRSKKKLARLRAWLAEWRKSRAQERPTVPNVLDLSDLPPGGTP